jgi:phosphate/phosphite/phosphonate ABC transporter binding protein
VSTITLAVVPSSLPGDRRAALEALCTALGKILGSQVIANIPASYAELATSLEHDRVQYAWMSPALMVLTNERIQLAPLLSAVRNERTDYRSVLFVDARRPASSLAAMHGRTVAWVDTASASGYLVPRIHLAARGIDPSTLFGEELFMGSHAEVVRAVISGRANLGATYGEQPRDGQPITRAGFIDVAPDYPMRVLEWTQPIPNDVIAGHGLISKPEQRAFGAAVLALAEREEGRKLLFNAFHADRFMATPRNALKPLWRMVALAREHGLLAQM